ncbi:translation initiation factor eIF3 subunit g [Entomortierella chlamydospora]|uniref:Eukaryotic translation initiation factor 3 subunit G n=1 Tax=Entomortierella chlamydospora TaxID=101097 RepID=A0A9P6SWU2_9FUNG|nr:translation initiation factor eIF3 subunit g [Entomortierella chlamydospora]KAG0008683.1 translation initiation factor eIF3 subunit g [Entomortierella chlamydospora]
MSTNWADEVDGDESPQTFTDANGITTHIEYRVNEDGKKIKITRRTRNKLIHDVVNKAVAARKKWPKFGKERGNHPGPDPATTSVGDNIKLKLSSTGHIVQEVDEKHEAMKDQLKNKKILCRICKGDHFTTKCPYKDSLGVEDAAAVRPATPAQEAVPEVEQQTGSKYIAPHLRASSGGPKGADRDRDVMRERREDLPTLRVTNLSEDATEPDVLQLFNRFGHITRVFLAKDRETNVCKGFAFVSFTMREDAQRALDAIDGRGYDNLILRVEWARSSA